MIAEKSVLCLDRFDILESQCDCIFSDDETLDLLEETCKYPVDIDFNVRTDEERIFLIGVHVRINASGEAKPMTGYSVSVSRIGLFKLPDGLSEIEIQGYLNSGVSICITNLRSYISTITSFYPLGRFSFHAVDMLALFKSKQQLTEPES